MGNEPVTLERATAHIRHWFTPALLSGAWAEDEALRLLRIFLTPVDAEPDAAAAAGLMDRFAAGDGRYWDSLRQFVGDRLVHDRPLGDTLRRWAGEVFRGDCTPPKKPRGAPPTMNPRNHLIVVAITLLLKEFDISATRNDESESVSACDAVVAVLAEREVLLAYKTVAAIWCQQPKNGYMPRDVTALFLDRPAIENWTLSDWERAQQQTRFTDRADGHDPPGGQAASGRGQAARR